MHAKTPQLVTDMGAGGITMCTQFLTTGIKHLGGLAINIQRWRYRRRLELYVGDPNTNYTQSKVPATQN